MSSGNKKRLILNTVAVDVGCGSCRKPIFSNIFQPKPKSKTSTSASSSAARYYNHHHSHYYSSSTSSKTPPQYETTTTTTSSFSPSTDTPPRHFRQNKSKKSSKTAKGLGRVGGGSVAVEKDSDDPYLDFRHSMLQMILENEIYSKDDLKELLNCFLQLNSPYHHGIIVRAFTEIWNGVYSIKSSSSSSAGAAAAAAAGGFSGGSESPERLHYYYGG